jgi:hypothetical protein
MQKHNVERRNVSQVPRNRWISTSHHINLTVYNCAILKIYLKTHEQNNFSKCNQCHKLHTAIKLLEKRNDHLTHLWRPNLGILPKDHRLNIGLIYTARTTVRKGRIMKKKNGKEQGKEHKVSYYVILINNVPTTLSKTLYYKKKINK